MTQLPITFVSNVCRDVSHHDISNSMKVEQIINNYIAQHVFEDIL